MPRPAPTRGGFERSRRLLSDPLLQTAARRADIASIRQPGVDDVARFLCGEAFRPRAGNSDSTRLQHAVLPVGRAWRPRLDPAVQRVARHYSAFSGVRTLRS